MQPQEVEPPAALQSLIKCFWHISLDFGELGSGFEVVPDGYAEIIFYFGSACHLVAEGGGQTLSSPFLVGLLKQPLWVHAKNQLAIIGIRCFPWTVFELLGLPPGPESVRPLVHPLAQLQPVLAACLAAGQLPEALAHLARYCLAAHARVAPDQRLLHAGGAMLAAHGTLPVSQVAAAAHATVRTLERQFKHAAGHTVKDVLGLMRFEQVRNHLWQHPTTSLAGLAQELGYTDQAHLSREFRRYSGTTPAAFARRAQREASPRFVAFVQA